MIEVDQLAALQQARARDKLLSDIASYLLVADRPQEMLRRFYSQFSTLMGLEIYFNYLLSGDGARLRLDSYAGVPAAAAHQIETLAFGDAMCGPLAVNGTRQVFENIQDSLNPTAALVRSLGVQAYISQPLLAEGHLIGTLSFGTRHRPHFEPDELEFLQIIANQVAIAIARKRAEEQMKVSLREKEVLLKEVHHRAKNNLQVIASLLSLQAGMVQDPQLREMLRQCQLRAHAMALVHETLYPTADLACIDLVKYTGRLGTQLYKAYGVSLEQIVLEIVGESVRLEVSRAIPYGLILNELLTNALKHAFPAGQAGMIRIALNTKDDQYVTLQVHDSGVGLPEGLDFDSSTSFGLQLISLLSEQLGGALSVECGKGTSVTLTFPRRPALMI